jgi:hypothetical protein
MKSSSRAAALVGLALIVLGYLYSALPNYLSSLTDAPGWVMDRSFYQPVAIPIIAGFLILIASLLAVIVNFAKARFSKK